MTYDNDSYLQRIGDAYAAGAATFVAEICPDCWHVVPLREGRSDDYGDLVTCWCGRLSSIDDIFAAHGIDRSWGYGARGGTRRD